MGGCWEDAGPLGLPCDGATSAGQEEDALAAVAAASDGWDAAL